MGQVRDIMTRNVVIIEHSKTARDAAVLLTEKDISFLVVVENEKPIGIVTERDLVRKVWAIDKKTSDIPLSDIMSYKFRSVTPTTSIEDAVQKMLNNNIRRLVVLEDNNLAGVITETDLASYLRSKLLIDGAMKSVESK
ncbi:MAG: histidine kinase [Marine Group I thaumarchaeote]|nr:MAG: Histidine kinase [Nitrosopumilales archaeon]GFN39275.1 MAG: histidine kinase [Marine Group I thaumarchaeote]